MNLTAIEGEDEIARLHFLDSLALLPLVVPQNASVIDIGTGAGFPGLVLKIARPSLRLTLLDSQGKRIAFLQDVCRSLGFDDVTFVNARAEEAITENRESFDYAVSRAVARLNVLCELCLPYVRQSGAFIAMKGPAHEEEMKEAEGAAARLGATAEEDRLYTIPGTEIRHSAILFRKKTPSDTAYPRRWSQIVKKPLC